jgi:formylglycine-generating enzyme required for sulfatase activity
MGGPKNEEERGENEGPQHKVRITKPFYMGRHEVTQEQWERVMGNNPSKFKGAKNPVEQVSWNDCQEFLKKLNALVKIRGTFRLPTEAEWEYACRAGSRTPYSFGDDQAQLPRYGWFAANSDRRTQPVGQKQRNAWGLYDMHGNVWEWCADWYGPYGKATETDPTGPKTGPSRVLRGGAWNLNPQNCQSASRHGTSPIHRDYRFGFRVVVVAGDGGAQQRPVPPDKVEDKVEKALEDAL